MSYLLGIETASSICSVAVLHERDACIALVEGCRPQAHAQLLPSLCEEVLGLAGVSRRELAGVVLSEGPGSYTGLRIGSSTAKGICAGLSIPLIALDTLSLLAQQVFAYYPENTLFCPLLPMKSRELCYGLYRGDGDRVRAPAMEASSAHFLQASLCEGPVYFLGPGTSCLSSVVCQHSHAHVVAGVVPSARAMAIPAWERYRRAAFENINAFQPRYLRHFVRCSVPAKSAKSVKSAKSAKSTKSAKSAKSTKSTKSANSIAHE